MNAPSRSTHEFRFDVGGPSDLAAMRHWMRSVLDGVSPDVADDAVLLATELVTNALDHAQGVRAMRLIFRDSASSYRMEVDDERPDLAPHPGKSSPGEVRGRGLLLVDALSHRWGVVTHGSEYKTVWAEIAAG
ncbi:ATP-binding protein [Amycolatopsis sp., V23-08]|uniref:ATP-binding protein n=1 Tax=Amycolatopsis heterodermiae TaxID=3110235 RepID=A0ABU5R5M1_9PSEU|nr:ATP-binding protein [Amycolatopsis sp., V23-08]MEA5360970.1 ATP-binding protein [Amycolatopsis sp., V23-08]